MIEQVRLQRAMCNVKIFGYKDHTAITKIAFQ